MRAINIVGFKNSGKTRLVLELAKRLEQHGLSVALVKHSHNVLEYPLDTAQSDTGRFRQEVNAAQGRTVAALGHGQSAVFWSEDKTLNDILPLLHADIILIEGGKKHSFLPRIVCLRPEDVQGKTQIPTELQCELALATYSIKPIADFTQSNHFVDLGENTLSKLAKLIVEKAFVLPRLNCGSCHLESCAQMAQALVAGERSLKDCPVLQGKVQLFINERFVPLNPFVARILAGSVTGMAEELKGVEKNPQQEQVLRLTCTY